MSGWKCRAALALLATCLLSPAAAAWEQVTVVVQEPSGEVRSVSGNRLHYGYYRREFTPKGVKDRLRVEKELPFADRDVRFAELLRIEFVHRMDAGLGVLIPQTMRITYQQRRGKSQEIDRSVGDLRGFGNPKPVLLILTTEDGKMEFDITPLYDEADRQRYRPILKVLFE